MKIMTVVGARPNFMKAAPIIAAIQKHNDRNSAGGAETIEHILVHTGQHYDRAMSDTFFTDLDLPAPNVYLGVGSASHAVQTAEIMRQFEPVLFQEQPDIVMVVGDVNSTVACALVAAKVSFDASSRRPLIAHVEAGLRSFDRAMPEEINRIVTDHLADILFVTEESGLRNLAAEGVASERVHFVGNTMIDSLLTHAEKADSSSILDDLGLRSRTERSIITYALLTLHRPSNVDNCSAFVEIFEGLNKLAQESVVVFPAHPRTLIRIHEFGLDRYFRSNNTQTADGGAVHAAGFRLIDPLGYLDFLCLMKNAALVVTDSGGIQEETTFLGVPCVTVRENTERPVTVEVGTNVVAGVSRAGICEAVLRQLEVSGRHLIPEKWDGQSGTRIVTTLVERFTEGI